MMGLPIRAASRRATRKWPRIITVLILAALAFPAPWRAPAAASAAEQKATREYLIKAAFLHDMLQYVKWPQQVGNSVRMCVLGHDKFAAAWKSVEDKTVGGRSMVVRHMAQISVLSACDVLLIGDSESGRLPEVIAAVADAPVLTVSELPEFAELGGMVCLREVDNKLRFDVNVAAARRAGIVLAIDVLQLADVIGDDRGETPQQGQR
jgi:YfiR/HmsC-like